MKNYLKLMRIKNWIKNLLICIPFIFSSKFLNFNKEEYFLLFISFITFSIMSSIIYIINDLKDIEKDKLDDKKKNRPLVSGKISKRNAIILTCFLVSIEILLNIYLHKLSLTLILLFYFIGNILYTFKLKNVPIIDITFLSIFFILRIFYGGNIFDIEVSNYLYLTTLSVAYYFGIGKRKKELLKNKEIRQVLEKYPYEYLEGLHNIFLGISILYYSLWVINYKDVILNHNLLELSIFFVIVILIYYHYILYQENNGNPTDILLEHKGLIFLVLIYCVIILLAFLI